jgi:thiol-disulfide isomerase/thioredoxin
LVAYLVRVVSALLPGLVVASTGYVIYTRRERSPKVACVSAVLLGLAALTAPMTVSPRLPERSRQVAHGASAGGALGAQVTPHSGEHRLTADGSFVAVADPRQAPGQSVQEGWQQALWESMSDAIQAGNEQVVMVLSRQGCPWCDRLVPVLENAIQKRAAAPAGAPGMLSAPLRVFILDAQEFAPVMQHFKVEGFPTMLVFGAPGVTPRLVPGYLDDENFDQLLSVVATAEPDPEDGDEGKKKEKEKGARGFR